MWWRKVNEDEQERMAGVAPRRELDVKVVTYDEILETQTNQLGEPLGDPYSLPFGTLRCPIEE
jgi:hypothetical protein